MVALVATLVAAGGALAASTLDGRIGPDLRILPNGRHLRPAGDLVELGNFPTGGAATPNGRFYWTISSKWWRQHHDSWNCWQPAPD